MILLQVLPLSIYLVVVAPLMILPQVLPLSIYLVVVAPLMILPQVLPPSIYLVVVATLMILPQILPVSIYLRPANPDTVTPVRLAIYKPVRKPVRNLRRMFRGTITQITIMKTLTKHQIAGNKSFIFVMVCHTVLQSNEHQTEASTFPL